MGLIDVLAQVHDAACEALPDLEVQVEDPTGRDALLLYTTLIELAGGVIALHRANSVTAVSTVARSALIAFVDIRNLLRDPNYWGHLELHDHEEWRKLLETASAGKNPFLAALTSDPTLPAMRKMHKGLIKRREAEGARRLDVDERFDRAGLSEEYQSLWAFLSAETHNNLSALITRHLTQDEHGKWVLDLYSGRAGHAGAALLTAAEMIMEASNEMHDRFGKGRQRVASIAAAVERARAAAVHDATLRPLPEGLSP